MRFNLVWFLPQYHFMYFVIFYHAWALTPLLRRPFKPAILFFNRQSADVLTRILLFASFAGGCVNTPHVAVTLCGMMCAHASVSRSSRGHGSVAPDKRHSRQWMSSLFLDFCLIPLSTTCSFDVPATNLKRRIYIHCLWYLSGMLSVQPGAGR